MNATLPPNPTVSRAPLQGRSKASLERMLATARSLMLERGNEEFTLQEVSKRGKVSIGSIYLRFDGKDSLVMAVLHQAMEELKRHETAMIERLMKDSQGLADFVTCYVEDYSEILRLHAPLLRLSMLRAEHDPVVSQMGKLAAARAVQQAVEGFLTFREEINTPDPALSAASAHHIIFATLARQLSLGSTGESIANYDWGVLKRELTRMCIAYLVTA